MIDIISKKEIESVEGGLIESKDWSGLIQFGENGKSTDPTLTGYYSTLILLGKVSLLAMTEEATEFLAMKPNMPGPIFSHIRKLIEEVRKNGD